MAYCNFYLFFCRIGSETGPCSTSSSRTMIRSTLLSSWSAGSDTPESISQSWNGPAKAPISIQSSIFGRSWSAESQEENSATRTSYSAHFRKNGTEYPWTPLEGLWSRCREEWRPWSRRRDTQLNIKHFSCVVTLFLLFIYCFVALKLNKMYEKSKIFKNHQGFFRYCNIFSGDKEMLKEVISKAKYNRKW